MILTYKYKLKSTTKIKKKLNAHSISVNQIWNYCNNVQKDVERRYLAGAMRRKWPSHFDLCNLTSGSFTYFGILARSIQLICKQYAQSRNKNRGSVKYRVSQGSKRSLGWIPFDSDGVKFVGIAELDFMKTKIKWFGKRKLPNTIKTGCFVEDASGDWYVCFHVEVEQRETTATNMVGIDLGLKSLATLSDGTKIEAPQFYRKSESKLAIAQRSGNKKRVRAIHKKIANQRKDMLHKLSSKIAKDNMCIVVGNVNSSKLMKTKMAKSVSDAGWSMFRFMLEYKARRHQAIFLNVEESYTSQVCSECGCISDSSPKGLDGLGVREWKCSECGEHHDRDVNSAINILNLAWGKPRSMDEKNVLYTNLQLGYANKFTIREHQ